MEEIQRISLAGDEKRLCKHRIINFHPIIFDVNGSSGRFYGFNSDEKNRFMIVIPIDFLMWLNSLKTIIQASQICGELISQ